MIFGICSPNNPAALLLLALPSLVAKQGKRTNGGDGTTTTRSSERWCISLLREDLEYVHQSVFVFPRDLLMMVM